MAHYYFSTIFYLLLLTGHIIAKEDDSNSESNGIATVYDCTSKTVFENFTLKWTIPNYELASKAGTLLTSPEFPLGRNDTPKWRIELEPVEILQNSDKELMFNIRTNSDIRVPRINISLTIETPTGNHYDFKLENTISSNRSPITHGVHANFLHHVLQWDKTTEKTLIVTCSINSFNSLKHICRKISNEPFKSEIWTQDITKFFLNDETLLDYTIFVQGTEFHVHKDILAARSKMFAEMFSKQKSEQISNSSMEIKDSNPETIGKMLHFLHTDEVKDLTVDNVLDLLDVADRYSISSLKNVALTFAVSHRTLIRAMEKFESLIATRPNLLMEFMDLQEHVPENVDNRAPGTKIDERSGYSQ